jgi:arylsulfatase A-like enzyme
VRRNGAALLRESDVIFTEPLKRAGYRNAVIGKWSLGGFNSPGYPTRKGFDEWFGFFSQTHAHHYYPDVLLENDREYLVRGNFGMHSEYAHDLFTTRALRFLENAGPAPFFLNLCYTIPHANNELGNATGNGMEVPTDEPYARETWPQPEKNFAAMVTRMDSDVGKIMAALKKRGLDDNTLVVFTSDNGPHREGGHSPEFFGSAGGLRGIKGSLYEGGIRVPAMVRWPGHTPAGAVSDFPWAFWDFFPTMAELAGFQAPAGLDGVSLVPVFEGRRPAPREFLYWEYPAGRQTQAVRMGTWKAFRAEGQATELYNLASDISEQRNVAAGNATVVRAAERIMASAHTEL